jgi:hypothetical protein
MGKAFDATLYPELELRLRAQQNHYAGLIGENEGGL